MNTMHSAITKPVRQLDVFTAATVKSARIRANFSDSQLKEQNRQKLLKATVPLPGQLGSLLGLKGG
jgi:hypothetical protein